MKTSIEKQLTASEYTYNIGLVRKVIIKRSTNRVYPLEINIRVSEYNNDISTIEKIEDLATIVNQYKLIVIALQTELEEQEAFIKNALNTSEETDEFDTDIYGK